MVMKNCDPLVLGPSVMSHCWYGRNRSVTLLVAYLMKYAGMSINEATRLHSLLRKLDLKLIHMLKR